MGQRLKRSGSFLGRRSSDSTDRSERDKEGKGRESELPGCNEIDAQRRRGEAIACLREFEEQGAEWEKSKRTPFSSADKLFRFEQMEIGLKAAPEQG